VNRRLSFGAWAPRATSLRPWQRALLPLGGVLLLGAVFNAQGAFLRWQTHGALLREVSVLGILACGMTVVILTGGIDLSVGSLLGLCAVGFAELTLPLGWSGTAAVLAVLALGTSLGLLSGFLIGRLRLPSFIVTLAMLVFARGLAKQLSGGQKVSNYVQTADGHFRNVAVPDLYSHLDRTVFGGSISVVTLVFLSCAALTALVLQRQRVGRHLLAIGGNEEAARLSGVPVRATLCVAYALSGLFAAVAGICQAVQEMQGDPETGAGYELDAIAMVVLGGTRLSGGSGGIGLTLIGVLTLGYLQKVLSLNAFSSEVRLMLTGVILVVALLFQRRYRPASET
jgi:ribose transport system permease protein